MAFDNSRYTFNPFNDYHGVVMEQGRVQLDSDWNEWLAELLRRIQAGTLDIMGRAAVPATTPDAFAITASTSSSGNNTISIGPGRMYVDGLLAENHGSGSGVWDPALAELSGSPQPPPSSETDAVDYASQPYLPDVPLNSSGAATALEGDGPFLAYLDVWTRPVTFLQDPNLVDPAVGVDTTGRLQTVWQVKIAAVGSGATCATAGQPWPAASSGLLTTGPASSTPSGPCCLNPGSGYTGAENQLYRLEIHQPGTLVVAATTPTTYPLPSGSTTATFKWSRDNASVATGVTAINPGQTRAGKSTSTLSVASMGRDQVLGFAPGNWIELTDDVQELNGQPGELHLIDGIDFAARTITLATPASSTSFPVDSQGNLTATRYTRIRRWDQSGKVYLSDNSTVWADLGANGATGDIPVPPAGTTLILEDGIAVSFSLASPSGLFNTGDYWNFAARTAGGLIDVLNAVPPRGIYHHYTPLSVVTFDPPAASNCRTAWPPASSDGCGCCSSATVGVPGSGAQFTSINKAIKSLGVAGGLVSILPGDYYEHVHIRYRHDIVLEGCGWQTRLFSPSLKPKDSGSSQTSSSAPSYTVTETDEPHVDLNAQKTVIAQDVASAQKSTQTAPSSQSVSSQDTAKQANETVETDEKAVYTTDDTDTDTDDTDSNPFKAVITIESSQHIQLRSFVVEAARDEADILIGGDAVGTFTDRNAAPGSTFAQPSTPAGSPQSSTQTDQTQTEETKFVANPDVSDTDAFSDYKTLGCIDITIEDLVLNASRCPAIFAASVTLLGIDRCRVLMSNVLSLWPAIQVSGSEIHIEHNYVGTLNSTTLREWLPTGVALDLFSNRDALTQTGSSQSGSTPSSSSTSGLSTSTNLNSFSSDTIKHPGGIQIAGGSTDVYLIENLIENCARNGITLGSFASVDANGDLVSSYYGVLTGFEDTCSTTGTLGTGTSGGSPGGGTGDTFVSGGILVNIQIHRNRIRNTGLCGIGPVGFFNLLQTLEVVTIDVLTITGNEMTSTLRRSLAAISDDSSDIGYGAITVPDVVLLTVRDNLIDTFGVGTGVCGIFVLNGEMVEISRNQILDLRTVNADEIRLAEDAGLIAAGIALEFVTPYSKEEIEAGAAAGAGTGSSSTGTGTSATGADKGFAGLTFAPIVPALRIFDNVVRVPAGPALEVFGLGPFSIVNNNLASGGIIPSDDNSSLAAPTVLVLNVGVAIETVTLDRAVAVGGGGTPGGTVLFANNICQLEAPLRGGDSTASVLVLTPDHLNFNGNHCWLQAVELTAAMDAFLVGGSINVTGNRFQESVGSVVASGFTMGAFNITTNNISTYCLLALGLATPAISTPNLVTLSGANQDACAQLLSSIPVTGEVGLAESQQTP